ncbi:trifunctional serine/threonine-protein kinase/ATP-binding protein/sensor histidine kinase [Paraburkholderia hospita]|uniref:trifunctional serine/threonine-protein kinase/ATP-binding protein/sensor histidine kinase n=1 Tax=Paraburkholderia hospita TaxID=169430 RepID=UPI000DEF485C|nr:trifunctional serine/threonine-protein kinase/ATP-binding protein/sensor histidine kinase [Paraburkholderia hospita]AXF01728.1 histidine kinase [Paraburkholderia hospita]
MATHDYDEMGNGLQTLWEGGGHVFSRARRPANCGDETRLIVRTTVEHPSPVSLQRLAHEFELKDELDSAWAVRPLDLVRKGDEVLLVLDDPGGEPLERLLGAPIAVGIAVRLAIGIAAALGKLHQRGLVHRELKPAHILVNCTDGQPRLTGFGIASRLRRERQAPEPPESLTGTFAYMAPEQTGRMNRSIDARSDLYAFGVTLYEMLTGSLPFTAADPMEWVHCHIARTPVPPSERLAGIPVPLSAVVMKLMAKTAEERYQTAGGVERDLRRCLVEWEAHGYIDNFAPGQQDTPDRLLIPEKLYGRANEIETLLASFDRIVKNGAPELVLVSGYSGIGKSAVVNELHRVLVPSRGLFAAGKFDQYKRDIPYSTLAQAFQELVRLLLGKSDIELSSWRDAFLEALAPNARLMVDLVPELKLIIGEHPPVPVLAPQDAQRRFQLVFQRFIGVFARAEHPLALFLDDLQWLDAATLDLLEDLLTRSDLQHLMLIGAYRDNEVTADHPLSRKLDAIKTAGGKTAEIALAPLGHADLRQLLADALRCEPAHVAPLAQLVHHKTGGNPFFAVQFLSSLADEGMLVFDHDAARWCWNLDHIHAKGYTDNVVELMIGKLTRLTDETQKALQQLACLGNSAEMATLSLVLGTSVQQVHGALWPAVRLELVERRRTGYRFAHDRVQEAAYSLIAEAQRGETHLRIGRLLAGQTPAVERDEAMFEIVNQLNRAIALIVSREERDQLAAFNLIAGRRAKASSAYVSALKYLVAGVALVGGDGWERQRELVFALELHRAECEFLTGALAAADERLEALAARAKDAVEAARVACLRVDLHVTRDQSGRAVAVGLECLQRLGIEWSPHPTDDEAHREYQRIWSTLGNRPLETLVDLPLMNDPASLATLDVLAKLTAPALYTNPNLLCLVTCRMVNLSLERGNADASCFAYGWLGGVISGLRFGDYETGYQFGRLGYELVEQRGLKRYDARVYMIFGGMVPPWKQSVLDGPKLLRRVLRRSFEEANRSGDLTCAAYSCSHLNTNLLAAGEPLEQVQAEAERGFAFAQKMRFGAVIDRISAQLGLVRTLRGLTPTFGHFDDADFDELRIEQRFAENPDLATAECWYWVRKLQARFFAGEYAAGLDASVQAQRLLWASPTFEHAEYHFYAALSRAACFDTATTDERQLHIGALADHQRQLAVWAHICPENFENRAALVGAEIARIEGRAIDAEALYEQAIRSAQANGFVHNEALSNELAARFFSTRGLEKMARVYLQDAHDAYLRWGADGKARQLEQCYPTLKSYADKLRQSATLGTPIEQLDLSAILSVSQIVSGEIVLENLIEALMRTAVEHAGAQRGLLVLPRATELWIEAQANTEGGAVTVALREAPISDAELPESILRYCARSQESVILDDASTRGAFSNDGYIARVQARSVLCLPCVKQGRLIALLYLENHLATSAFTPARIAVLKVLASQAAMTLENATLYRDLAEREAKIRRLVDANIVGIFVWDLDGRILEANDAFLRVIGYDRDDLLSGRLRWSDLTPPEWHERDRTEWMPELRITGTLQPFEKEYFRKDGSRVPVLIGVAMLEERGTQSIAFVLDLSERKRAEAVVRKMQQELAHANRVATMGQLTASIAHEINQPVAATVTNAQAALRWLRAEPPDVNEVGQVLGRIVKDGNRAAAVIGRIRELVKKAPPRKEPFNINTAIRDVVDFTRGEARKHGASVQTRLADQLPHVHGDLIQLQQVLLNLLINAMEAMSGVSDGVRELTIGTAMNEPDVVMVTVCDSGPGVAPVHIECLFEPFYTTKSTGLGMGLSICRSIIEAHGGRLWARANVPHGAIFEFTIPVHSAVSS